MNCAMVQQSENFQPQKHNRIHCAGREEATPWTLHWGRGAVGASATALAPYSGLDSALLPNYSVERTQLTLGVRPQYENKVLAMIEQQPPPISKVPDMVSKKK